MSEARRLEAGAVVGAELETITGERITVPDTDRLVHLQFRRFAGCPICSTHLRSVVRRHEEIAAAGIREVVLFHTPVDELRPHAAELPFAVVADPDKKYYREFGVEAGLRAMLHPRVYGAVLRGLIPIIRRKRPAPPGKPHGGSLGLPADFLIAPDGHVLAATYGRHAYDQWPVDELLALARARSADPRS